MDFEDLKKNWNSQQVNKKDMISLTTDIKSDWEKQQRKLKLSIIFVALSFTLVFIVFIWVYIRFHEGRTIFFSASLCSMAILMIVYFWVLCKGIAYKNESYQSSSIEYLTYQIKKLDWLRKTKTTYIWIYSIILWISLMFYMWDITIGGSLLLKILAPLISTLYIFGTMIFSQKTKIKKQLIAIDGLIEKLKAIKENILN